MHPLGKPCSKRVTRSPHGLRRQRVVVARNQEERRMLAGVRFGTSLQALPKSPEPGPDRRICPRRTSTAFTALRRATSRILAITSIRARDNFFCPSSGNDGKRRPRCQSAVCSSLSTTSPDSVRRSGTPPGTAGSPSAPGNEARGIRRAIFCKPRPPWIPMRRCGVRDSLPWWPA